jgi:hypothetical protein
MAATRQPDSASATRGRYTITALRSIGFAQVRDKR